MAIVRSGELTLLVHVIEQVQELDALFQDGRINKHELEVGLKDALGKWGVVSRDVETAIKAKLSDLRKGRIAV